MNILENYVYENEYFKERAKNASKRQRELNNLFERYEFLQNRNINVEPLSNKIQEFIENQINDENELLKILDRNTKVEKCIESMSQPYKNIFYYHYIENQSFEKIADKMSYSLKRVYQLHKIGMDKYSTQIKDIV